MQLGQHPAALENFNNALRLQPDNYLALNNRAIIYNEYYNDPRRALEDLEKAINVEPAEFLAYKNRGDVIICFYFQNYFTLLSNRFVFITELSKVSEKCTFCVHVVDVDIVRPYTSRDLVMTCQHISFPHSVTWYHELSDDVTTSTFS